MQRGFDVMTLKPIRNDQDYQAALQAIEQLWDAEPGTPESDMLDIWVTLVEAYEKKRYDLPAPDPVTALVTFMVTVQVGDARGRSEGGNCRLMVAVQAAVR